MKNNLEKILSEDKSGNDEAMSMMYSDIYDMIVENKTDECEEYLKEFLKMDFSLKLQCGFARITKPHKEVLKSRERLIEILKDNLYRECPTKEEAENVLFHVA